MINIENQSIIPDKNMGRPRPIAINQNSLINFGSVDT